MKTPFEEYLSDDENRRLFNQESLILEVTEVLCRYMDQKNISRSDLANKMGRSKGFVSQLLGGSRNLTLRTLADVAGALGCGLSIQLVDKDAADANLFSEDAGEIMKKEAQLWVGAEVVKLGKWSPKRPGNTQVVKIGHGDWQNAVNF